MEMITLLLFGLVLAVCIAADLSILYALAAGLVIFCGYARMKGFGPRRIALMLVSGIKTAKNILIVFLLIGMLTALWRACGTMPVIICYAVEAIRPETIVVMTFLLTCGVSMLTGTSFGTAATMGAICMTVGRSMGADPLWLGGAVLSGSFFGDRCSPVSTSALLVAELTGTNIFDNIKKMFRTAWVPFFLTCAVYALAGWLMQGGGAAVGLWETFGAEFHLHWLTLLPAAVILVLSQFRVNVKLAMSASILTAAVTAAVFQRMGLGEILYTAAMGYRAADREVGALLNGGGIISMLNVSAIICISSSYSGIFKETALLTGVKGLILSISRKITPFGGIMVTSVITSMVACNQSLAIMLTSQLCAEVEPDREQFAIDIENSTVTIAPLVPWSIAGGVPLATIGGPTACILFACFLYLLPAYTFVCRLVKRSRKIV